MFLSLATEKVLRFSDHNAILLNTRSNKKEGKNNSKFTTKNVKVTLKKWKINE